MNRKYTSTKVIKPKLDFSLFPDYNLEQYKKDVLEYGLKRTWDKIIGDILTKINSNQFISVDNFSEFYEIGLALINKQQKKESGQYYTPDDVALVMASWFNGLDGTNICDVACGTGKLILAYLQLIGKEAAITLIRKGQLYLYDLDDVALSICKVSILVKYGMDLAPYIHDIRCDFLSKKIVLPHDCKVISNPPYATVETISTDWDETDVAIRTKEKYAMFMEKIMKQSVSAVIITPYSFINAKKFYSLRKKMNDYNGFIVSFDNVPGTIFAGKKHGIFNSNKANSVRAAITVFENKDEKKGFRLTPLIRFKNEERKDLLKTDVLENFINDKAQSVSEENTMYCKCDKKLGLIWETWKTKASKNLGDYITKTGNFVLSMPNTCRYYTTASKGKMERTGQILLKVNDEEIFNYIFCLINSSFTYWYWRIFDGGITYTKSLLLSMPVFYDMLGEDDKRFFNDTASEMIKNASNYVIKKNNVGIQKNIKYPRVYRDKINRKLLDILGLNIDEKVFDSVHSNMALEVRL